MSERLKGEGEVRVITRTRLRHLCEFCEAVATKKHTFLLPHARSTPQSSTYSRDDCTWCSDSDLFTCESCGSHPFIEGYEWCSTFSAKKFPELFLFWHEKIIEVRHE